MKINEIRLKNARHLSNSVGGICAFADKTKKAQTYISEIIGIRPVKNIGGKVARDIEQAFNKSEGWLDNIHPELYEIKETTVDKEVVGTAQTTEELPAEALEFARLWLELPSDQRAVLSNTAKAFVDSAKKPANKRKVDVGHKPKYRKAV